MHLIFIAFSMDFGLKLKRYLGSMVALGYLALKIG